MMNIISIAEQSSGTYHETDIIINYINAIFVNVFFMSALEHALKGLFLHVL